MTLSTRCRVDSLTRCDRPLITLETVIVDTPACRATSVMVTPLRRRPAAAPTPHLPPSVLRRLRSGHARVASSRRPGSAGGPGHLRAQGVVGEAEDVVPRVGDLDHPAGPDRERLAGQRHPGGAERIRGGAGV